MSEADERRRAVERAVAIVVLVDGGRRDIAVGGLVSVALGAGVWLASARWLAGAIALALAFPVAARLARVLRRARLRGRFAADQALAARAEAEALARATPGQRAALMLVTKPRA
jgi:hypothetical protein